MFSLEEIKQEGLDDFRNFLREVWKHLSLPRPTPVQNDIANELQSEDDRLVIEAFRGIGKSWETVAFALWVLFLDNQKKVLVTSANQKLADDFSIFAKQLVNDMDILKHLRPRRGQRDSNLSWDVGPATPDKSPSVKSVGLTGQLTGSRADIIIPDDIEITKNSYSQLLRERNGELVKEFDAILKPGGKIRYLGTPQTEQSLYNQLEKRGYKVRIWPVEIPSDIDQYRGRLAPIIMRMIERGDPAGTPTEPTRFPREEIDKRLASYGRSGFELQFMLNTNPSDEDKHPLKARDLLITDLDAEMAHVRYVWGRDNAIPDLVCCGFDGDHYYGPVWKSTELTRYTGTVMAIDPSGKGKDETAYAILRYLYGNLFLVSSGGFRDGYSEMTLKLLAAIAATHRVTDLVLEENFGGGMFAQLLKPHMIRACQELREKEGKKDSSGGYGKWAEDVWHSKQKESFICDTLEPIIQSHRLIVDRRVIEKDLKQVAEEESYSLIYQMTRMHREKGALAHEDRLEALAMAAQFWQDKMDRDGEKMHARHNEALLDAELRKFKSQAMAVGAHQRFQQEEFLRFRQ